MDSNIHGEPVKENKSVSAYGEIAEEGKPSTKKFNLLISQESLDTIRKVAERNSLPVSEVMRRFIDLGLFIAERGSNKLVESKAESTATFHIRIIEEPLRPHNLTSIISAITELSTKCWLIAKGRFDNLIEYTLTKDVRFVEEAQLIITKITYNSPLEANFKIDLSASNLAEAITTAIDGVVQVKQRLEKAELENKAKAQEIEHAKQKTEQENKDVVLERERKELAIERERLEILERRLDVQKKGIEFALEIAAKTIAVLYPNADEQAKAMLIQTLLPPILQLQNDNGLTFVLPAPLSNEDKTVKPENE